MDENQVPRMMDTIEVFADVSYAPGGEAYRSIQGVLTTMGGQIIQWHTGRQSLIATSTAEGELLASKKVKSWARVWSLWHKLWPWTLTC